MTTPATRRTADLGDAPVLVEDAADSGPTLIVTDPPVARPVFRGQEALKRLGTRASWMYLVAGGLAVIVQPGPGRADQLGTLVLLAGTGSLVVAACKWPRFDLLVAALAMNTLMTATVVQVAIERGWPSAPLLVNTVATGATVGLALGRRPRAGLLAALLAVTAEVVVGHRAGSPFRELDLLAIPTSTIVSSCIQVMAGRGFVETEAALRGVDDALATQRVAAARWQAGRRADRDLHDTVLTTLTLLSHRDFDIEPGPVRELCRRDLAFLAQDSWRTERPVHRSEPALDPALPNVLPRPWLSAGLQVRRLGEIGQLATLGPVTGPAVDAAVEECLLNVTRHAGVSVAEVVVSRQADDLVVLVVDQGRGFDPDQVPDDRLGLAESVRGRITDIGGSVAVWSRPGTGTTVMLSVPIGRA